MPRLTANQLATLRAHLAANTATVVVGGTTFPINSNDVLPTDHTPPSDEAAQKVAAWYNLTASPTYLTWHPAVPLKTIRAAVDLSKFTPADSPPAATNTTQGTNDGLLYQNRALACQLKQANAIFLVSGEGTVDATPQQFRQSFFDCMTAIPSGSSGANQNAGWGVPGAPGAVRLAMQRAATAGEKLLSSQAAGAGAAGNVSSDALGSATNPAAVAVDANGSPVLTLTATDIKDAWKDA